MAVFFWILIGLTWIGGVISMLTENFNLSVSSVKQIRITLPAKMVSCLKKLVPKNQGTDSFFLSKLKTQNGAVPKQNGEALISTRESNREFLENMSTASVKGLKIYFFFASGILFITLWILSQMGKMRFHLLIELKKRSRNPHKKTLFRITNFVKIFKELSNAHRSFIYQQKLFKSKENLWKILNTPMSKKIWRYESDGDQKSLILDFREFRDRILPVKPLCNPRWPRRGLIFYLRGNLSLT